MAAESDNVVWDDEEWLAAESAIEEWLNTAAKGSGLDWKWRDRAATRAVKTPYAEIWLQGESAVGRDEVVMDEAGAITISGNREVVLTIQVRTRDQSVFRSFRRYLGRLRQTLEHPLYAAMLSAGGLGLVECEPIRKVDVNYEGRVESVGVLDVRFSLVEALVDEAADAELGYVDIVEIGIDVDQQFTDDAPTEVVLDPPEVTP